MKGNYRRMYVICLLITIAIILSGCPGVQDYEIDIGDGYFIERISSHVIVITEEHKYLIPEKVIEVGYNEEFIIAKQLGLMDDPERSNSYQIPNENDVRYWIVNKINKEIMGPLTNTNFEQKLTDLNINLELKKVKDLLKR
ncbi:DUF3997 domain-containing protein [Longirhabdus pacifica]|uniref:DUF3997 domain-containing protein n=1 Tax=Longirhabdus pacifica TaxID=2305227 RepID=UPI0010091274|nr:DUF3997 domain-containing protein [Longirhabdus pacifica]